MVSSQFFEFKTSEHREALMDSILETKSAIKPVENFSRLALHTLIIEYDS